MRKIKMFKEMIRLLMVCLKIIIVLLAIFGIYTKIHSPLNSVPTCREYGYSGFDETHMNKKTSILSIQCIE